MLVITCDVGQSLVIEDVQLTLIYANSRSIIFSLEKLAGGRQTKVSVQRHQIVDVCYNVKFQLLSVSGQTAKLLLEPPENVQIETPDRFTPTPS